MYTHIYIYIQIYLLTEFQTLCSSTRRDNDTIGNTTFYHLCFTQSKHQAGTGILFCTNCDRNYLHNLQVTVLSSALNV